MLEVKEENFLRLYWAGNIDDKQVIGALPLFTIKHSVQFQFLGFTSSQHKCIFCLCSGSVHYLQSSTRDTTSTCDWKWYSVMSNIYRIVRFTKSFRIYPLISLISFLISCDLGKGGHYYYFGHHWLSRAKQDARYV